MAEQTPATLDTDYAAKNKEHATVNQLGPVIAKAAPLIAGLEREIAASIHDKSDATRLKLQHDTDTVKKELGRIMTDYDINPNDRAGKEFIDEVVNSAYGQGLQQGGKGKGRS
jgi:hypothetical protein